MAVITDILKRNPVFAALSDDELEALGQLARDRPYRRGEVVFLQGDEGDALYGIHAGQVRVSIDSPDGETRFLNLLGAGEVFGEIALLDGGARTATATAMEPARLAVIERSAFLDLVMGRPQLAIRLLELVCARARWASDLVEDAAFLPGPARLAKRLLGLQRLAGEDHKIRISQAALASFSGLSRQVVNQQLKSWSRAGYLETGRGTVRLLDVAALERLVMPKRG
jgi:CRP-like cAMP-binding protein